MRCGVSSELVETNRIWKDGVVRGLLNCFVAVLSRVSLRGEQVILVMHGYTYYQKVSSRLEGTLCYLDMQVSCWYHDKDTIVLLVRTPLNAGHDLFPQFSMIQD